MNKALTSTGLSRFFASHGWRIPTLVCVQAYLYRTQQDVQALIAVGAAIVEAAEGTIADIVQCTIYISDISHWAEVNGIYGAFFGNVPVLPATPRRAGKRTPLWSTH